MLESAACARGKAAAQAPAHGSTADEAEEADPRIGNELPRYLPALGKQGLAPALRQPGLVQEPDEAEAGEWRVRRRLDDHRAAGGNRRGHLMHDQVERVVEGAERYHHADRLVPGVGNPVPGGLVEPHRHDVARLRAQKLGTVQHPVDSARHLDPRVDQRLASLLRRPDRQLLGLFGHAPGGLLQNPHPRGWRKPGTAIPKEAVGGLDRCLDRVCADSLDRFDQLPVIGGSDLDCRLWHGQACTASTGTRFFSSSTRTRTFSE